MIPQDGRGLTVTERTATEELHASLGLSPIEPVPPYRRRQSPTTVSPGTSLQ